MVHEINGVLNGVLLASLLMAGTTGAATSDGATTAKPNIIFILADDLDPRHLGCFGQQQIQTPCIDRMAGEGMRFTQLYTGTSICAPARASLLTGLHMGHCPIRANRECRPMEGQMPLPAAVPTVAKVLKAAGYATACTGKWGLGMFDTTGSPLKQGFDHFFGYNCQRHAHDYYPAYLYSDDQRIALDGKTYSEDLIIDDTLKWVRAHAQQPFFLYFAVTLPHAGLSKPSDSGSEYAEKNWPHQAKVYASMVSRLDRDTGRILDLLKELKLDEKTIVFFSGGDNGVSYGYDKWAAVFAPAPEQRLRGSKTTMYEGGLRQGGIVRWPGQVPGGKVCDEPWAFWDFLPTAAELANVKLPASVSVDGRSVLSALRGGPMPQRPYFYWELFAGSYMQAARFEDWKAVRPKLGGAVEIYNLKTDPSETQDLAAGKPELVAKAEEIFKTARDNSPDWVPGDDTWRKKAIERREKAAEK